MKFYWHIHHDILMELSDNIEERIKYINERKPKNEIEIRLRLLKEVKGKLPEELVEAGKVYYKAMKAYDEAGKAYYEARKVYYKVYDKYKQEIEALHKQECPSCTWNGETIFY